MPARQATSGGNVIALRAVEIWLGRWWARLCHRGRSCRRGHKIFLAELVDNMRAAMLATGAASASDLDEIRDGVEHAARDPERVFYQARIHQVCGRRPD
jgi:hypothetical protein